MNDDDEGSCRQESRCYKMTLRVWPPPPGSLFEIRFKFLVGPAPHPQPMASQAHHQSVAQLIAPALRAVVSPLLGGSAERVAIRRARKLHGLASQRMRCGWSEGRHSRGTWETVHTGVLCVVRFPRFALVGPGGTPGRHNSRNFCQTNPILHKCLCHSNRQRFKCTPGRRDSPRQRTVTGSQPEKWLRLVNRG